MNVGNSMFLYKRRVTWNSNMYSDKVFKRLFTVNGLKCLLRVRTQGKIIATKS